MLRSKRCGSRLASWKAAALQSFRKRDVRWQCRLQATVVTRQNGFGRKDRLFVAARVSLAHEASPPLNAARHKARTSELRRSINVDTTILTPLILTTEFLIRGTILPGWRKLPAGFFECSGRIASRYMK